jgi:predicted GNAT family acetyltransferase
MGTTTVRDNPEAERFEISVDGKLAGFAAYKLHRDRIAFTHTEVDDEYEGHGLAKVLVTHALDDVRCRQLGVLPFCPYVRRFISKNPAYVDLVPEGDRERFDLA